MDGNNWRPQGGETPMETGDWRAILQPDSRQRIVNKIMETLKRHLPVSGNEGLNELKKIAQRFEEKIYTAATSQSDYLRKISLKMLTMESKSNTAANSAANSSQPPDPGLGVPSQVHNQGQSIPIPLASQPQSRQQLLAQNMQNNISSAVVQSSTGLQSALPPVSGLTQNPMTNVGQNSSMQSMSGGSQHSVGNSMGQGVPPNMFGNAQRQMQGRQQVIPQQQQQQAQNTQQYMFQQQQLQQQMMKQKLHHGNIQHQLMQSHIQQQQQQQQSLLQPNQLQSSQQSVMQTSSVMQPSIMESSSLANLQPHQQSNNIQQPTQGMLQQHSQAVMRQQQQQTSAVHQQQMPMSQQPILPQQQLMSQQSSAANIQQNQLLGQQNSVGDIQHQQQRLLGHQNNVSNIQQQHQQLVNQQSSIPNIHQQQLGGNMSSLQQKQQQQQQQLLLSQSGNSSMQTNQQAVHILQQSKLPLQQQAQPNASNLLPPHGQQSQAQQSHQQLLPQIHSQPSQLQQQLGMQQQQSNPAQRDMQQRLQQSSPLLQQQNALDQKQLYQSQRAPETSSTSLDSTAQTGQSNGLDWQEEVMQKIKTMRELYMPDLTDLYQKIASKIQQFDALPQAAKTDNVEKIRQFKQMLERTMAILSVNKNAIMPALKDKLPGYEKQILHLLSTHRPKKPMQQGQLPPPHMQAMQQPQSQGTQGQSHDNQMNSQLQTSNLPSSVAIGQQNSMKSLQQNSMPSVSGISTAPQNMMTSLQPVANLDSGQANAMSSMQQVAVGSLQQNPVSAPQQTNTNAMTSQVGVNMLQSNLNNIQTNSNLVQQQHLKQQHDQSLQNQQLKQQIQNRHFKQQLMQRQQMLQQQQLTQHIKQPPPVQMQTHQQPQIHQINDINEFKRQGVGHKSGVFQQQLAAGQRSAYPHQQLKSGAQFLASSPQLLQAVSPQIMQYSSPQVVDQQNLPPSISKTGTPLQSANSPFVGPTPSPPLAPSPAPAVPSEPEKPVSSVSSLGTVGQQTGSMAVPAQSLAIATPGISASPLLAECTVNDGAYGNALAAASGKSTVTEQPIKRLIKAVTSMSPAALGDSVSDMSSVITMMDRIAGAAPGNGSRAAVGEDLVAMTKCRLQARNFITQDGSTGTKKMRRYTSAMPLKVVSPGGSITDSLKQVTGSEISELESTATSCVKRPRTEANHALLEEIREINRRLIDTKVDVSDEHVDPTGVTEVMEGTVVKCSYTAVALCPSLKLGYASAQMLPIQPLRLLVPTDYPNCSPILLDKFPVELSRETDDQSEKAKSKFSISLRSLSQPMSLKDIARTWDICAREVILEYAQRNGGGSFSSKYGAWEKCLSAAS